MHRNAYDSLAGGTPRRLRQKREYVAKYPNNYTSWRDATFVGRVTGGLPKEGLLTAYALLPEGAQCHGNAPFKIGSDLCRWVENATDLFPLARYADKIVSLRHTGWYVDNDQSETTRGIVFSLPGRRGYLAGLTDPWNFSIKDVDGPCIVELHVYGDEDRAARAADGLAEAWAEDCREDEAKQAAESQIDEARDEIADIRTRIRELVAGIRESTLAPIVCETLRADIRRQLHEKTQLFKRIAKLKHNFWDAVPR